MNHQQQLHSSVHLPFSFAVGATASRFYCALRDEKTIYGTRCDACEKVSVPARSFCSHCRKAINHQETDRWVALPDCGTLVAWCETPSEEGFFTALIQLEGASNFLLHRIGQCNAGLVRNGMQVSAVWKDPGKGTITDIICFRPSSSNMQARENKA